MLIEGCRGQCVVKHLINKITLNNQLKAKKQTFNQANVQASMANIYEDYAVNSFPEWEFVCLRICRCFFLTDNEAS